MINRILALPTLYLFILILIIITTVQAALFSMNPIPVKFSTVWSFFSIYLWRIIFLTAYEVFKIYLFILSAEHLVELACN